MTNKIDWTKAAGLPPDDLARLLEQDHDEVDDNPPATAEQLTAAQPGKRRPGQRGPGKRPAKVLLTMRVEPTTLEAWEASGEGWRGRIGDLLKREAPMMPGLLLGSLAGNREAALNTIEVFTGGKKAKD